MLNICHYDYSGICEERDGTIILHYLNEIFNIVLVLQSREDLTIILSNIS